MVGEHLLSQGEHLRQFAPMFSSCFVQQDANNHQDQVEPGFIIAVDLNKRIKYNRQVPLKHCRIGSWYLLDTGENRIRTVNNKELLAKVQSVSDMVRSGGVSGIPASVAYLGGAKGIE